MADNARSPWGAHPWKTHTPEAWGTPTWGTAPQGDMRSVHQRDPPGGRPGPPGEHGGGAGQIWKNLAFFCPVNGKNQGVNIERRGGNFLEFCTHAIESNFINFEFISKNWLS